MVSAGPLSRFSEFMSVPVDQAPKKGSIQTRDSRDGIACFGERGRRARTFWRPAKKTLRKGQKCPARRVTLRAGAPALPGKSIGAGARAGMRWRDLPIG
jgi:hypothetical protein